MNQSGVSYSYDNSFSSAMYVMPIGEILQVSELSMLANGEVAEHDQSCDEITYAISGKAKIYSGDKVVDMQGGQIHFIKKNTTHRIVVGDENFRYICIGVNLDMDYEPIRCFTEMIHSDSFIVNDDGNTRVLAELLINEFYFKDAQSDTMINLYLTQIFITLARILKETKKAQTERRGYSHSSAQFTLYHALRYIDREYINIQSVKEIAAHLSYSEFYLSHLFKEKMGMTIKEYILRKKIMKSIELLQTSNLRVDEIANYLHFGTPHAFSQAFKRIVSVSPMQFKKQNDSK